MRPAYLFACAALLFVAAGPGHRAATADPATPEYQLAYEVRLTPSQRIARVAIRLGVGGEAVRTVRLRIDPELHFGFESGDPLEVSEAAVVWRPGGAGSALRFSARIDHLRDAATYDARLTDRWALFRADDLVPPARVDADEGAESRASLRLSLPEGWRAATRYPERSEGVYDIENPRRRFDRPTGWMVVGRIGVLREKIAGCSVAVAAPAGQGFRRQDVLALLRWTMPALHDALGSLPERLLVVGAGDPMWRGGLSGPGSIYLHADRPMIANDGTSPLLHELVHVATGFRPGPGGDWIVEGIAELYAVELLRRSRTISARRYRKVLARLRERGASVAHLETDRAAGDLTARAVGILHDLDRELRARSSGAVGLDQVVASLAGRGERITTALLREEAEAQSRSDLGSFFASLATRLEGERSS